MMLAGKIFVTIVRIAVVVLPAPALGVVCSSLTEAPRQVARQT
jgi:hypothetical protein